MTEPRIITGSEAESIRDQPPRLLRALLAGAVLHFPDSGRHFNATTIAKAHGRKLRSKSDGEGGRYWWVE
jgi:hypothetical protein